MFCKHDWKILSEHKTESQAERYGKITGKVPIPKYSDDFNNMIAQRLIQVFTCNKCGKLKRFVTNF